MKSASVAWAVRSSIANGVGVRGEGPEPVDQLSLEVQPLLNGVVLRQWITHGLLGRSWLAVKSG